MRDRVIHFLRPTFFAVILLAVFVGVANLVWFGHDAEPDFIVPGALAASDLEHLDLTRVVLPSADLAPEEVVRLQLAGLSDEQADGVGILQCYCFASPANRAVTGPLDRFGAMVRQGEYHCMASPQALLVGRPQGDDRVARVLVTVIDQETRVRAFTFVLGRQQDAAFKDCWMTEAVLPAPGPAEPDAVPVAPRA